MKKINLIKIYGFSVVASLAIMAAVAFKGNWADVTSVLILAGLEITFSFENAVINAKILSRMSRLWQTLFLTVGIFLAVFIIRFLLPIIMVCLTAKLGFTQVIDLALNHPDTYASELVKAHPMIASFGGIFLLMLFLDFIFENRAIKWLTGLENVLARIGKIESMSIITALSVLLLVSRLVPHDERSAVLAAGLIGIILFLFINALDSSFVHEQVDRRSRNGLKFGFIGFLYLEMIDASFSLDGVIGAFAITNKVLYIAAGLGIGALFVRAATVHIMRMGILKKYIYLDHGAHYAIAVLACLLLVSIRQPIPEWLAGTVGIVFIATAIGDSYLENRRHRNTSAT